MKTYKTCYQNL